MKDESAPSWLPDLVQFDWNRYQESIERAHCVFQHDFGMEQVRPRFRGKRMGLKKFPELDRKSATFWHFISEGKDEENRIPDRERVERIAWPKAMIEESTSQHPRVLVWQNERTNKGHGKSTRWVIALPDFSYVVIIDERDDFCLPWTAYTVTQGHRREKLKKEYQRWRTA